MSLMRRLSHAAAAATIALGALTALAAPADAAPSAPAVSTSASSTPASSAPARLSPLTSPVSSQTLAGYAVAASRVANVSAIFRIPVIAPCPSCSSIGNPLLGTGIDGFNNNVFEQAGLQYDLSLGGWKPYVSCFPTPCDWPIPTLPDPAPGDQFSVALTAVTSTSFSVVFTDLTQGWSGSTSFQDSSAQLKSGEAFVEDATSGGSPQVLPNFGTVAFSSTKVNNVALSSGSATQIVMVTPAGRVMAQPSAVSSGAFSVNWVSAGP